MNLQVLLSVEDAQWLPLFSLLFKFIFSDCLSHMIV